MELQMLLGLILTYTSLVSGQPGNTFLPDTDIVTEYPPLFIQRVEDLEQNPDLLQFAARTGERVIVRIVGPEQPVVAQEFVNVNIDCWPWARIFEGGTIRWFIQNFNERDEPITTTQEQTRTPDALINSTRLIVGGEFNRWLNITRTIITQGAQDSSNGRYTCSVCRPEPINNITITGTTREVRLICHNASALLFILGRSPDIVDGPTDGPGGTLVQNIGANFCIMRSLQQLVLQCVISNNPVPVPTPSRMWSKDDVTIYNFTNGASVSLSDNFTMATGNDVYIPNLVNPIPLQADSGGGLSFTLAATNITMPNPNINESDLQGDVFRAALGTYVCEASNIYGTDRATTTIRECVMAPVLPTCAADVIFRDDNEVAPVGCNVCIPQGSTVILSCTATSGSEPISYEWRSGDMVVSNSPTLEVTMEGDYNCTAGNIDNPGVSSASVLFFSSGVDFTATITNRFGDVLNSGGCDRLRSPLASPPDVCVLIGEQLDMKCVDSDTGDMLSVTDLDNMIFQSPQVIGGVEETSTYQCSLNTPTPCGTVVSNITVQVFDPATVELNSVLLAGELGAGRDLSVQEITNGDNVVLACPTNGVDDPMTGWFRVVVDVAGRCSEVDIDTSDPDFQISTRDDNVTLLSISNYNGIRDDGTYVCRTSNIVGNDAGVVVLSSVVEIGIWSTGESSQCNVNCNEGTRVRSVICRSSLDRRILPESRCVAGDRPPVAISCLDLFSADCFLNPIFVVGRFSPCNAGCKGGTRERDVSCIVPMTGEKVADQRCSPLQKPNSREFCPNMCCRDDAYPACRRLGSSRCNILSFQQFCCWTCLLREIP